MGPLQCNPLTAVNARGYGKRIGCTTACFKQVPLAALFGPYPTAAFQGAPRGGEMKRGAARKKSGAPAVVFTDAEGETLDWD